MVAHAREGPQVSGAPFATRERAERTRMLLDPMEQIGRRYKRSDAVNGKGAKRGTKRAQHLPRRPVPDIHTPVADHSPCPAPPAPRGPRIEARQVVGGFPCAEAAHEYQCDHAVG